jgi:hypothetical protein
MPLIHQQTVIDEPAAEVNAEIAAQPAYYSNLDMHPARGCWKGGGEVLGHY